VRIQEESRTMATITFQNLFRIYNKLAGMTGTAETEAQEFHATYKLDVTAIPTNRSMVRKDTEDLVYKTEREKFTAVIKDILEKQEQGRPVLVGTTSVEKSGAISRILNKKKVPHAVLNAKHHENEAYVVAQAGRKGAITVSTNMAGRGTDIILGGNPEMLARLEFKENNRLPSAEPDAFAELVKKYEASCKIEHDQVIDIGGLHIVGTERHESRRIDNQLRGRAGRQGDPGSSRFYLSLEDDLMRIFAGDRVKNLMDRMGMPDDEPIEHPWVTRSVENAQRKVEERNFDIRKNLLEYDDVMNAQRKTVYALRQQLLEGRYTPEEVDELGKATGRIREIPIDEGIRKGVAPLVAQLFGMFAEHPVTPRDDAGRPRPPTKEELGAITQLVELETLEREVYGLWGVKFDVEGAKTKKPSEVYEGLEELVAHGLSEQRERVLDLIDRVVSAMVEESCPRNRQPEDWDWTGIHEGFKEHVKKPLGKDVDDLGELERLVRTVFERAEAAFLEKEKEVGVEHLLRLFRHFYLEEIDREWVDHLTNMEHLRDGIGLRGYGQRDPKNEYKKEGYDLFLNMMANVSSNVLVKAFEVRAQRAEDIAAMEAEAEARHHQELEAAIARHPGAEDESVVDPAAQLSRMRETAQSVPPRASPATAAPKIGRNDLCPCGSGKKFKKCHGAALEDEEEEQPTV
jgi:preprotein translocase subunit SecA